MLVNHFGVLLARISHIHAIWSIAPTKFYFQIAILDAIEALQISCYLWLRCSGCSFSNASVVRVSVCILRVSRALPEYLASRNAISEVACVQLALSVLPVRVDLLLSATTHRHLSPKCFLLRAKFL